MEATHTKRLCRVRRLDRGVQARGIEVPAKESGARAKGTEVPVKVIGTDGIRDFSQNVTLEYAGVWTC